MFEKCTHKWTKFDKEIFPSVFQQVDDKDRFFKEFFVPTLHEFKQMYILILICENCGKIKKIREWSLF